MMKDDVMDNEDYLKDDHIHYLDENQMITT